MSKKRMLLHLTSISLLSTPNIIYLTTNFSVLKEANAVALTLTAMLILSLVGLGTLAHFKANPGIWVTLLGLFILAMADISHIAGIALIIEGGGLTIDGYVLKPLITSAKMEELEKDGKSVTYTREL